MNGCPVPLRRRELRKKRGQEERDGSKKKARDGESSEMDNVPLHICM